MHGIVGLWIVGSWISTAPKSDSSSTIKPKKKKESSGIDIESTRLASTPTSISYRLEEESDLSETLELSINNSEALTTHMMPHTN